MRKRRHERIVSFGTHRLWRAGEAELVSNLALLHLECAPPDEVGDGAPGAAAVDGLLGGVVRVLHAGEGHVAEEAAAAGEATGGLAGLNGAWGNVRIGLQRSTLNSSNGKI